MKKKLIKILLWLIGVLFSLVLIVLLAFQVSPKPGALLIGRMFNGEVKITDQSSYNHAIPNVSIELDRMYHSTFKKNNYDIYYPKNVESAVPVLIWVHGGGFVGGDKEGVKEFATKIVSDTQVAVVSMNYEVAPSSYYPNQVIQVGELIKELTQKKYKQLDLSKLFFGGDSAGAQIALQYVTTQTNPSYAKSVGIDSIIDNSMIKGAISYCGPVDLKQVTGEETDNKFMKFFVKTVAWSLLGTKNWQTDPRLGQASLVENLTDRFPPTYITDGNAYSFQNQGISLENRLSTLGVPVEGLFYKNSDKVITHEYQFDYATTEAKNNYQDTLDFINKYNN